jgi:hypothetical protein
VVPDLVCEVATKETSRLIRSTHLYEEGLVLVQINDEFPEDKADEYGEVLKRVA